MILVILNITKYISNKFMKAFVRIIIYKYPQRSQENTMAGVP